MTRSRTTNGGCACRVPIADTCVPQGLYDADALNFLADRGIDVKPDYMGRLSIPVADAQALWDEAAARATVEVAARARADQLERERLAGLAARRQKVFETELYAAAAHGVGSARAMQAARNALAEAEADLDASTRSQLGPVWTDDGRFSSALLAGLQAQVEESNQANLDAI